MNNSLIKKLIFGVSSITAMTLIAKYNLDKSSNHEQQTETQGSTNIKTNPKFTYNSKEVNSEIPANEHHQSRTVVFNHSHNHSKHMRPLTPVYAKKITNPEYYINEVIRIKEHISRAEKQMSLNEYSYALNDIRKGIEIGTKCIITFYYGENYIKESLNENLKLCKPYVNNDLYNKLHSAKNNCSKNQHDSSDRSNIQYNTVHFCKKTLEELQLLIEKKFIERRSL